VGLKWVPEGKGGEIPGNPGWVSSLSQPHFGISVRVNPTLPRVGTWVLRDSRKFRARVQGPKHLALGCSLYHWKGLEV
jgi:hypothetical protein